LTRNLEQEEHARMSEVVKVMIAKKCLSARFPSDLVRKRDGKRDPRHSQSVSHHCVLTTQKTSAGMGKLTVKKYENVKQKIPPSSSCATLLRSNRKLISRTQLRIERAATGAKKRRRNGTTSHEEGGSGQARNARTGAIDPIRSQTNH